MGMQLSLFLEKSKPFSLRRLLFLCGCFIFVLRALHSSNNGLIAVMTKLGAHPVSPVIVAVQEEVVVVGSVIIPVISPDENGVDAPTIIHSVDTSSPHAATPLLAQPFPRWGSSNDSNNKGIDLPTLLDFTRGLLRKEATTVQGKKSRARFPETLYILDPKQGAVWSSQTTRARTWNVMIKARVEPTERLFAAAARLLLALPDRSGPYINEDETETVESSQTWPHLRQAATAGHSVPFFVWYGDYKDCNHLNWKGEHSIPLFTTCAHVNCSHAFPIPNYEAVLDSQLTPRDWDSIFATQEEQYTWESKLLQIVWRGSLSDNNDSYQSARWRLCVLVTKLRSTGDPTNVAAADWFNVGFTSIPARHNHLRLNVSDAGGLVKPIPEPDFQRYAGILDVDGNAWSSRFGQLLCYNSVVLKVEPVFVEYFYKDLIAWEHYVPVRADLSDLVEIASFVLDPDNEPFVRRIVMNANKWCRQSMVQAKLVNDTLDVLESYVGMLHAGDPSWTETWGSAKEEIFAPSSGYAMIQL